MPPDVATAGGVARRVADEAKALGTAAPPLAQSEAATIDAMPPEQMIRGMVEKLASQLAAAPSDPDGWMRLGRAYAVLGETDKAMDAYDRAALLRPDGLDVRCGSSRCSSTSVRRAHRFRHGQGCR